MGVGKAYLGNDPAQFAGGFGIKFGGKGMMGLGLE